MLAERFGLKIHREKKEMPAYDLVIAKNGPKLAEAAEAAPDPPQPDGAGRPGAAPPARPRFHDDHDER
jgi:uncharacterized protein (TIGR03435 family)